MTPEPNQFPVPVANGRDVGALTPLQFNGRDIRLVEIDGRPWFVAADVARELGYGLASDLTRMLDDDEKGMHPVPTLGGSQYFAIISEPGLYRAFAQRRALKKLGKPVLENIAQFQRWVFHDVLPSIRKTGAYGVPALDPSTLINDREAMASFLLAFGKEVEVLKKDNAALEKQVSYFKPKSAALDRIATAHGSLCITDAAKLLNVPPMRLFRWLSGNRWIYKRGGRGHWIAYQNMIHSGYLDHKATTLPQADGTDRIVGQVVITPNGISHLSLLLAENPRLI